MRPKHRLPGAEALHLYAALAEKERRLIQTVPAQSFSELGWERPILLCQATDTHSTSSSCFSQSQIRNRINDLRGELQCFPAVQVSYGDLSATMEKDEVHTIAVFPAPDDGNVRGAFDVHSSPAEGTLFVLPIKACTTLLDAPFNIEQRRAR